MTPNNRYVSAQETGRDPGQWRVVGDLLQSDATTNQHHIVDTMQPITVAPRIQGNREDPLSRGYGFAIISIPFTLTIILLVAGLTTLAFVGSVFIAWLMTGIGGVALIVLAYVYRTNEGNSPGAVDRHWANVEQRKHDNDTEVRLAMVQAERDIRLARLQLYRQLQGGTHDQNTLPTDDRSPRRLQG